MAKFLTAFVTGVLGSALLLCSVANASPLPEYFRLLRKPLDSQRHIPITYGLENELGCRLVHGVELCTLGMTAALSPDLLFVTTYLSIFSHRSLPSMISARLTKAQLDRTLKKLNDPNIELNFFGYTNKPGRTQFELKFRDENFSLYFKADPFVLEVTATPFTLQEFNQGLDRRIDFGAFQEPRKTLVKPAIFLSGGHINIGVDSAFGAGKDFDLRSYRNFIIDFVNHSEIYHGALLYDPTRIAAKPVLDDPERRAAFGEILADLDAQLVREDLTAEKVVSLRKEYDDLFLNFDFRKGFAINPQSDVIEIRSVRAQKDIEYLRSILELFQARIETVSRVREPLPFLNVGPIRSYGQGLAQFETYVRGSNLDWERYKKLLPRFWRIHRADPATAFTHNPKGLPFLLRCSLFLLNR